MKTYNKVLCPEQNDADNEGKAAFYGRLQEEVQKVPADDVLLLNGNLNANVGNAYKQCDKIKSDFKELIMNNRPP